MNQQIRIPVPAGPGLNRDISILASNQTAGRRDVPGFDIRVQEGMLQKWLHILLNVRNRSFLFLVHIFPFACFFAYFLAYFPADFFADFFAFFFAFFFAYFFAYFFASFLLHIKCHIARTG